MHAKKRILLAVGLAVGAAALTGCSAAARPVNTPTPMAAQQQTAQPATAQPEVQETVAPDETPETEATPEAISLLIGGEKTSVGAILEQDKLMLPLVETAEKLGWKAENEQTEEETQTKRVIPLEKDKSRITVSWTVSDNTAKNISWQKDGLLIPVDTHITTIGENVYVPAAFFEVAMDAHIDKRETNVIVSTPKPDDTPKMTEDSTGENG